MTSLGGSSFFLVIIDDFSRYIWVRFLRHKSEAIEKFKIFKTMIELQTCQHICAIQSDRGGEFLSLEFTKLCESTSIVRQLTNANTLEQNGVAERANRKLLEMARSMTAVSITPRFLWTEVINTAAFIINRSPTIANSQVTPFHRFFGTVPDISFLRIFDSKVHVWIEKSNRDKLDAKTKIGLFLGYDKTTKGFRI